ncbi:TIGR02391 family protein [Devosia sp. RR2S18]|uniref:TIGR02391 family protein n=1 Tax=Devosia rhizosphaerae TaxID=3049774 RepID=UPI0025422E25|nr:TIGR02391 family protein [Devosia sp. RR2S18]WIJ25005.1 TIGR02391 family protein [Devosia sp. RR2S18]
MPSLLEGVRQFREYLLEVGAAQSTLNLPAPRMLAYVASDDELDPQNLFGALITEPEIVNVSRDLFVSGHFSLAIQEALKALEKVIQTKAGNNLSGTSLMEQVFSPKVPLLVWSARRTRSEQDEQLGYHRLFSGAVLGIRNPCAHEFKWVDDAETGLEILCFAQHLLKKAKVASRTEDVVADCP